MGETENPSLVGIAMRDLSRLRDVAAIVARHGFGPIVMKTAIGRRLFAREKVPEGDAALRDLSAAERFAKLLPASFRAISGINFGGRDPVGMILNALCQ